MSTRKLVIFISLIFLTLGSATVSQASSAESSKFNSVEVKAKVSFTQSKRLIRELYLGYQQAKSWPKRKAYILKHNYPGLYRNMASKCLNKLSSYENIMPDLTTLDADSDWYIPRLYAVKLAGTKPKGQRFVFEVNHGQEFSHATILDGKAYFFLWICEKPTISSEISINREYLKNVAVLADEEDSLLSRYNSVTGVNYTSEAVAYQELASLIPDVQILITKIGAIPTLNAETRAVNQSWISAWASYLNAWSLAKTAVETGDRTLIPRANDYIISARNYMSQATTLFQALKR